MNFGEYVREIRKAIRVNHGCESIHLRSEPVEITHETEWIWTGKVEYFSLSKCDDAKQCYGWGFTKTDGSMEYVTVLHIRPVDTAMKAVQSHIVAQQKREG